jgi:flavodoxin
MRAPELCGDRVAAVAFSLHRTFRGPQVQKFAVAKQKVGAETMKTLIVYFSKFGNTQKVAEAIADTLVQAGEARVISIDELTASGLNEIDLLVVGSPTHYQNIPKAVREVLKKMPHKSLFGKSVAAFDTSIKMWGPVMLLTAAHRLRCLLRALGGKPLVPPKTFLVESSDLPQDAARGRVTLRDGEIERAKAWADLMLRRLEAQSV